MAAPDGPAPDHLAYLREAAPKAERYGFFALVRGAEARAPGLPRVGGSRTPAQNVVDLAHAPLPAFPGRTIDAIEFGRTGRPRIRSLFLGLTGPMGPLPLHLTEYAHAERRQGRGQPFGRFLDLLTDRLLQFFYRAWADTQPVVAAERPADDRFARYLAALSGGAEGVREGDAFPALARLHYVGVFAGRRSAAVLQDALSHVLRTPVRIEEFVVRRREIEPADRTRIGRTGGFNRLGRDTILGGRVPVAEDTFRVVVRTRDIAEYETFLPGERRYAVADAALHALAPSHLDWEVQLEISEPQARIARLDGRASLGRTSWLAPRGRDMLRADARLRGRRGAVAAQTGTGGHHG
jgi:type VI secretion system protein ImpH